MNSKSLRDILERKEGGSRLIPNLNDIRDNAKPLLAGINAIFPDYTPHNIEHKEEVIENFSLIIPDSLSNNLNVYEIFFLLAATYLHDIGMSDLDGLSKYSVPTSTTAKDRPEFIRKYHHLRSEEFITTYFQKLGIKNSAQAKIIARIARGHRGENLEDPELFNPNEIYDKYVINIPLLSGLLRVADELDLTFMRTPLLVYEHLPPRNQRSREEWEKHLSITGLAPLPDKPHIIACRGTCSNNPKIHRALLRLQDKVNEQLALLPSLLFHYRNYAKDLPREFKLEIEPVGYKLYDFKFTLSEKDIFTLLMGERLYRTKDESIRELLKNAVDTIRRRTAIEKKKGNNYEPKLLFRLSSDKKVLEISDNGTGMNEHVVRKYFTKIGQSFYTSDEFSQEGANFTPVGELGIGFLSSFMIANKILVETKSDDSQGLRIEIDDVSDYFIVRDTNRKETGTTIQLFLKDSFVDEFDLSLSVRKYAAHLEFPVTVMSGGNEWVIENLGNLKNDEVTSQIVFEEEYIPTKLSLADVLTRNMPFSNDFVEGNFIILGLKDDYATFWPILYELRTRRIEGTLRRVSFNGILIGDVNISYPRRSGYHVYYDVNVKKPIIDLNAARNTIIENEKFIEFSKMMEQVISDGINSVIQEIKAAPHLNSIEKKTRVNKFILNYCLSDMERELEEWLSEQPSHTIDNVSFINLFRQEYNFRCFHSGKVEYLTGCDLPRNAIVLAYHLTRMEAPSDDYILFTINNCQSFDKDKTYVVSDDPYLTSVALNLPKKDFRSFLSWEESGDLKWLAENARVLKFERFGTERIIEMVALNTAHFMYSGNDFALNRDNPFIDMLVRKKGEIEKDHMLLAALRRLLTQMTGGAFNYPNYHLILQRMISLCIISPDEIERYSVPQEHTFSRTRDWLNYDHQRYRGIFVARVFI